MSLNTIEEIEQAVGWLSPQEIAGLYAEIWRSNEPMGTGGSRSAITRATAG